MLFPSEVGYGSMGGQSREVEEGAGWVFKEAEGRDQQQKETQESGSLKEGHLLVKKRGKCNVKSIIQK